MTLVTLVTFAFVDFQDVLVAMLSLLDVASGAVLALSFGFLLLPSAVGFLIGGIGSLLAKSVTPVSFQQENLVLAFSLSKDMRPRVSMILGAAFLTGLLGVLGLPQLIVDTIGAEIFFGMLAGVGIYLTVVGYDLAKKNWLIGAPCLAVAIIVQLRTDNLVWAVATSVPLGIIIKLIQDKFTIAEDRDKIKAPQYKSLWEGIRTEFKAFRPVINFNVIIGGLAIATLTLGGTIAYTAVNLDMSGFTRTYNEVSMISGVADFGSSFFGGAPMEVIVSATAATPNPIISGAILMFGAAALLLSGLIYKIARYIPLAAMGGYLVVIGAILVLPFNTMDAFAAGSPVVVALTMGTTAATNPFYGLVVGLLTKLVMGWLGVL